MFPLIPIIAAGVGIGSSILDNKMSKEAAAGKEPSGFEKTLDSIFDIAKPILGAMPGGQAAGAMGAGGAGGLLAGLLGGGGGGDLLSGIFGGGGGLLAGLLGGGGGGGNDNPLGTIAKGIDIPDVLKQIGGPLLGGKIL